MAEILCEAEKKKLYIDSNFVVLEYLMMRPKRDIFELNVQLKDQIEL